MPDVTVKLASSARIAKVVGWIVTVRRKATSAGAKRRQAITDFDEGVLDPMTNQWVMTLAKATGPRVRRNMLHVVVFDRRGRILDRLVRKCKR